MSGLTHWWKDLQRCCYSVTNLWLVTHEWQHSRLPCPSLSPWVCSSSCPLSWWCHPTSSSSVIPFSTCPQSFPASGSFPMSQLSHQVAKVLELQHQPFQWIFGVVQLLSCVWLFVTPWTAACQASLSLTISWSLLKFMSIELAMLSNIRVGFL